jgi:hypothetical protein
MTGWTVCLGLLSVGGYQSLDQENREVAKKRKRRREPPRPDRRTRAVNAVARDGVPLKTPDRYVALQPVRVDDELVCFPAPFAWILNLDLARTLRDRGERARRRTLKGSLSPIEVPDLGPAKAANDEKAANDALAYLSAAVFLAFAAIEAYANEMIERLEPQTTVKAGRRRVERDDMTRELTIEDKLKRAVPLVTGRHIAGDSRLWEKFTALKQLRDELVHLKERGYSPDPMRRRRTRVSCAETRLTAWRTPSTSSTQWRDRLGPQWGHQTHRR